MRVRKAYPENPCTSVLGSVNKRKCVSRILLRVSRCRSYWDFCNLLNKVFNCIKNCLEGA